MSKQDQQRKKVFSYHSKTFYFASRFLDNETVSKIQILYDFCRYCDNVSDDCVTLEERAKALTILEKIENEIRQRSSSHTKVIALINLIGSDNLSVDAILDLLSGFKFDLGLVRIKNETELLDYCYKVAGTIGILMCPILKCDSPLTRPYAIKLGIALQLTNIARDVREDAYKNRIYLPISENISDATYLLADNQRHRVALHVRKILQLAEQYYNEGLQGLAYMHSRNQLAILIAARIYQKIGFKIEKRQYAYWHGRVKTSFIEKCLLVIQSLREWLKNDYANEHSYL
jgi:phytoene synthase